MVVFLFISSLLIFFIIIISLLVKSQTTPSEDIVQLADGRYVPMANGKYLWIGIGGSAEYFSMITIYNSFKSKEDAKNFLNKWKSYRGIGAKSVGVE